MAVGLAMVGFAFMTEPAQARVCVIGYDTNDCIINVQCFVQCCNPDYCCYPRDCAPP